MCVLCSSHSSQGINNSFPGELDEALLGWFVHGLKADHNHPFCVRHSFWFSACIQGDYANIGVLVLSQTKVQKALSSVSISDRCQRESKSKENMYYKFPRQSSSIHFCRRRSFVRTYWGSASLPGVQFKVLSQIPLRFFWPLHSYLLSAGAASLHNLFLLSIYSVEFPMWLPLEGKPFIFHSQSLPKTKSFSWLIFPVWRTLSQKLLFWNAFFPLELFLSAEFCLSLK